MSALLLLQARTSSSRLPAKVLLSIAGMPLVVLAALRAGNTGHRVIVVTSCEPSDDNLCDVLEKWGIECFRGSLMNTLERFVQVLSVAPDEQVVVRLTGDNVLPDGAFIDQLLQDFTGRGLDYLCVAGEASGLPCGVSAEVTRAGHLRDAYRQAESQFDREHVTPKIIERFGRSYFEHYSHLGMSQYRCTVDTLDDFLLMSRLFRGLAAPEGVPLDQLLERLRQLSPDIVTARPAKRMVLGTAQFGLDYGIANANGRPAQSQVDAIVHSAISNGVHYIDTARAYGESEQVLGAALSGGWHSRATVITKLAPLDDCPPDATPDVVKVYVDQSVYKSCHALGVKSLDTLMLHRAQHLISWHGAVWRYLCELRQQNLVNRLGVSVQSPDEAMLALGYEAVELIQLPYNILDYRWDAVIEKILQVRVHRPLEIHVRSTLLQGLLTTSNLDLWEQACCSNATDIIRWLSVKADLHAAGDVIDLSLRYVLSQDWIDGVVIGVDTREQLADNLVRMTGEAWGEFELRAISEDRPNVPAATLNPAEWERQHA